MAHKLDSPKLQQRLIDFMTLQQTHMKFLHEEPIDMANWEATIGRLRHDLSLLVSQLTGGALAVRTLVRKADPWNKMVEEMNKA